VPFDYFRRLSRKSQAVYRRSDELHAVRLPSPEPLRPFVDELRAALERDLRDAVELAAHKLVLGMCGQLDIPPVRVQVLAVRPSAEGAELHGLYTTAADRAPVIRVWMRTAQKRRVVAFRTFLRTLLHEVCHHLDFTLLELPESFHTEGFFKRESSLFHQLVV
jgi:hypothetical protein